MKERRQRLEREREIAEQRCRERRGGWRTEHDSPELTDWLNRLVDDDGVVYFLGLHQLKFILPLVDYSDEGIDSGRESNTYFRSRNLFWYASALVFVSITNLSLFTTLNANDNANPNGGGVGRKSSRFGC
jgi:hypothetical protein